LDKIWTRFSVSYPINHNNKEAMDMARFTGGWIKLWRKAIEGDLPGNVYLWALWNWLLFAASWKPTKILWNGEQREIPPGTVVMGLGELATKWDCSRMTIKRWLEYLEKSERISLETCTRGTLVTIRNWELYQNKEEEDVTPSGHEVDTGWIPSGNELALSEEVKNIRNNTVKRSSKKTHRNYSAEFEEIYNSYPRKEGKSPGFKIYQQEILTPEDQEDLKTAIARYKLKKQKTDPNFLLKFSTFMHQWRDWLDEEAGTVYQLHTVKLEPKRLEDIA
jgi:hypothetical protein